MLITMRKLFSCAFYFILTVQSISASPPWPLARMQGGGWADCLANLEVVQRFSLTQG